MSHYAIVVDLDRCIGCHGCEIACKNENEVELGSVSYTHLTLPTTPYV